MGSEGLTRDRFPPPAPPGSPFRFAEKQHSFGTIYFRGGGAAKQKGAQIGALATVPHLALSQWSGGLALSETAKRNWSPTSSNRTAKSELRSSREIPKRRRFPWFSFSRSSSTLEGERRPFRSAGLLQRFNSLGSSLKARWALLSHSHLTGFPPPFLSLYT